MTTPTPEEFATTARVLDWLDGLAGQHDGAAVTGLRNVIDLLNQLARTGPPKEA